MRLRRPDPALLVVLGGIAASLHVGKLAPALPSLGQALGVTLLQAGFLLSLVQLAGMTLGLAIGLAADGLGLRRTMIAGLLVLSAASLAGGWTGTAAGLMVLRAAEGLGFLLVSMPAPGLIRRLVHPDRMARTLGLWGAYMPLGMALALLCGPTAIAWIGWPGWWWSLAGFSVFMAGWLALALPADPTERPRLTPAAAHGWPQRLGRTLRAPGPWLVALSFAVYSSQWLAVIGFLPTMYSQLGLGTALASGATALAALVNMIGNVASGRLLQRGGRPHRLLYIGFAAMAVAGFLAFAPIWEGAPPALAVGIRYVAVLAFSMIGGLIPGTLFSLAVRLAPDERTVSTTVGWMQQFSSLGQFAGPPIVAWVAARAGGWQWSWLVTGCCAASGLALAALIARLLSLRSAAAMSAP